MASFRATGSYTQGCVHRLAFREKTRMGVGKACALSYSQLPLRLLRRLSPVKGEENSVLASAMPVC